MNSRERFGERAEAYAAHRPGYAPEAIDALFESFSEPASLTIADIGAGTGISSRTLAERGPRIIAIEPNLRMREQGMQSGDSSTSLRIEWTDGTGEMTGLPDGSVDIAVAFQAFHWFATPLAMKEFRRIARYRGAIVQYERDERDPFTSDYATIVRRFATDDTEALRMRALDVFAGFPHATVKRHVFFAHQGLDAEGLLGRVASSSYLPKEGPAAEALQNAVSALFEEYAIEGRVRMMMQNIVITADWESPQRVQR